MREKTTHTKKVNAGINKRIQAILKEKPKNFAEKESQFMLRNFIKFNTSALQVPHKKVVQKK